MSVSIPTSFTEFYFRLISKKKLPRKTHHQYLILLFFLQLLTEIKPPRIIRLSYVIFHSCGMTERVDFPKNLDISISVISNLFFPFPTELMASRRPALNDIPPSRVHSRVNGGPVWMGSPNRTPHQESVYETCTTNRSTSSTDDAMPSYWVAGPAKFSTRAQTRDQKLPLIHKNDDSISLLLSPTRKSSRTNR